MQVNGKMGKMTLQDFVGNNLPLMQSLQCARALLCALLFRPGQRYLTEMEARKLDGSATGWRSVAYTYPKNLY